VKNNMAVPMLIAGAVLVAAMAGLFYVVFAMTDWWEILTIAVAAVLMMFFLQNILDIKVVAM